MKKRTSFIAVLMLIFVINAALIGCGKSGNSVYLHEVKDGDSVHWSENVKAGEQVSPEITARTGYTYAIFSDKEFTEAAEVPYTAGSAARTLYLKWTPISYSVRFNSGGATGKEMDALQFEYDKESALPVCTYTKFGEEFVGWTTSAGTDAPEYQPEAVVKNLSAEQGGVVELYAVFDDVDHQNFIIEDGVVTGYTGKSRSIRLPNGATEVAELAFAGNTDIFRVIVPATYTDIGFAAFMGCRNLTQITLPFIGGSRIQNRFLAYLFGAETYEDNKYVFDVNITYNEYGDVSSFKDVLDFSDQYIPLALRTVIISEPLEDIPEGAFYHHYSLERLIIDSSNLLSVGKNAFRATRSLGADMLLGEPYELSFLKDVLYIGDHAFTAHVAAVNPGVPEYEGYSLYIGSIATLPELTNVVTIGEYAFAGQYNISSLNFGNRLETIGESAFASLYDLRLLTLPDGLKTIDRFAFYDTGLTEVRIGNGINSIGEYAFLSDELLQVIFTGDSVPSTIARTAFAHDYVQSGSGSCYDADYLGIFVDADLKADFEGVASAYRDIIKAKRDTTGDELYYFYDRGFLRATFKRTEGHAMLVNDPLKVVQSDFLGSIGTTLNLDMGTEYMLLPIALKEPPLHGDNSRPSMAGREYVEFQVAGGRLFWNTTAMIDQAIFVDPETGESSFIPAIVKRGTHKGFEYFHEEAGTYYMDIDKYGNLVKLQKYVEGADGLEKVDVPMPAGAVTRRLEVIEDGSSLYASYFNVMYFDADNSVIEQVGYAVTPILNQSPTKPGEVGSINFKVTCLDELAADAPGINYFMSPDTDSSELILTENGFFSLDLYKQSTFIVLSGQYRIPAQAAEFGDEGFKIELYEVRAFPTFSQLTGTVVFSDFRDREYFAADIRIEGKFSLPDDYGNTYSFDGLRYLLFADPDNEYSYTVNNGNNILILTEFEDGYYVNRSVKNGLIIEFAGSGYAVKSGDGYLYTEEFSLTTTSTGGKAYDAVYSDGSYTMFMEFEENGRCFDGTVGAEKLGFHVCEAGTYQSVYTDSTNATVVTAEIILDGSGRGEFIKYNERTGAVRYRLDGSYERIEDATALDYDSSYGYYLMSFQQYIFTPDDGDYYPLQIAIDKTSSSYFSFQEVKEVGSAYIVYDQSNYKVGELRQGLFNNYTYIPYTYTVDENGDVTYQQLDEKYVGLMISDSGTGTQFYLMILDSGANILFYVDVIDIGKKIALIDEYTRKEPVQSLTIYRHFFIPSEDERTPINTGTED